MVRGLFSSTFHRDQYPARALWSFVYLVSPQSSFFRFLDPIMSSVVSDILQEVPYNKLIELRNVFKHNWPTSVHVYYLIDTCIQIIKQNPDEKYVTIYCPEGVFNDGTIVVIIEVRLLLNILLEFIYTFFYYSDVLLRCLSLYI